MGALGPVVLRLVRQDWVHRPGGYRKFTHTDLIRPYESSITGAIQQLGVDQRTQQRVARHPIQTPQALRLFRSHAKPRHFNELALNAPE